MNTVPAADFRRMLDWCEDSLEADRIRPSWSKPFSLDCAELDRFLDRGFPLHYPDSLHTFDRIMFQVCYLTGKLRSSGRDDRRRADFYKELIDQYSDYRYQLRRRINGKLRADRARIVLSRLCLRSSDRLRIAMDSFPPNSKDGLSIAQDACDFLLSSKATELQLHLGACAGDQMDLVAAIAAYAQVRSCGLGKKISVIITFRGVPDLENRINFLLNMPCLLVFNPSVPLSTLNFLISSKLRYRIRCSFGDQSKLLSSAKKAIDAGHREIQAVYSVSPIWSSSDTLRLLREFSDLLKYARSEKALFVNGEGLVREPSILNEELTVDYNRAVFANHNFGGCHDFGRMNSIADLSIDEYQRTSFEILRHVLSGADTDTALKALQVGFAVDAWVRTRNGRGCDLRCL